MNGPNGTSSTPLLLALVATGGLTLALVTYVLARGGENALASSAVIVAFAATIIGPLVVVLQTRALQANMTQQVAAVKEDVAVLTVQTDGKLNALMAATKGQAAAEGELRGAAAEQERAAALAPAAPVAPVPVAVVSAAPADVRVVQLPGDPVPVQEVKDGKVDPP